MSYEVNFSSGDSNEFDQYYDASISESIAQSANMHQIPFSSVHSSFVLHQIRVQRRNESEMEQRIQAAVRTVGLKTLAKGISGEAGIKWEWGGNEGSGLSGYVSGSASDDKGNKAEVEVEVNSDGSGNVTASVSHEED